MDTERLHQSPIGRLVPIQGTDARHGPFASFAYVPGPLPVEVDLSATTWSSVVEASAALARLDQACTQLNDPSLLIRPALWREALETSRLEGTEGQLAEILVGQLPSSQYQSPETQEILGYAEVALAAFDQVRERPISVGLLAHAQAGIFKGAPRQPRDVGKVREHQVWIGPPGASIEDARFVPAPGDDRLRSGLEQWAEWVDADLNLPPVLRAAIAHYQFETLHPFGDGNGRIGRLVIVLQLFRAGTIAYPALTISPWLFRHREEYQDQLLGVSLTGEWDSWVQFFCRAVAAQAAALIVGADRLVQWLSSARRAVNSRRWTGTIHALVPDLTRWPIVSIQFVASTYKVTPMAATHVVNHLVELGILKELTGRSYGRLFGASEIMDIVESI